LSGISALLIQGFHRNVNQSKKWTETTCALHARSWLALPCDLTDAGWTVPEPLRENRKSGGPCSFNARNDDQATQAGHPSGTNVTNGRRSDFVATRWDPSPVSVSIAAIFSCVAGHIGALMDHFGA
jgi:hypothetical protein